MFNPKVGERYVTKNGQWLLRIIATDRLESGNPYPPTPIVALTRYKQHGKFLENEGIAHLSRDNNTYGNSELIPYVEPRKVGVIVTSLKGTISMFPYKLWEPSYKALYDNFEEDHRDYKIIQKYEFEIGDVS